MCKVLGCKENHGSHYCKHCHSSDSNHFSADCQKLNRNHFGGGKNTCRVKGCKEGHDKHYCKHCHDPDADHFSAKCQGGRPMTGNNRANVQRDPNKCRVPGCPVQHAKHFCKYCKNEDANHRSHQCYKKDCCKVKDCKENHKAHLCRICGDNDSNHHSKYCPRGIILYHGSKGENLASIVANKLRECKGGRIGDGIYFTKKEYAGTIAAHRTNGNGEIIVVQCVVNESDCIKGDHPPWAGINHDFPEWCLTTKNYRILGAYIGGINGKYVQLCYTK